MASANTAAQDTSPRLFHPATSPLTKDERRPLETPHVAMQVHASKRPRVSGPNTAAIGDNPGHVDRHRGDARPKARKACVNCRHQKMRCVAGDDARSQACRRCLRTGVPCVFLPRANAASGLPDHLAGGVLGGLSSEPLDAQFKRGVLRRLQAVEEYLGFGTSPAAGDVTSSTLQNDTAGDETAVVEEDDNNDDNESDSDLPPAYAALGALWQAVAALQASAPPSSSVPPRIWRKRTLGELWLAFHERMPGLHFMPRKQIFSAPQPLLLASILYCSSVRGPLDVATELAPHYFGVLCQAIAQLMVPESPVGRPIGTVGDDDEEWAFQTVLGIVLASLLTEASNRVVGLWISVAYRLILEHCPADEPVTAGHTADNNAREWRKLFSGVQIIDLEHASLHLSCPVIPMASPLPALHVGYRDQLYRLSRMMHTGLTHFTGRGLPTIWSVFDGEGHAAAVRNLPAFTATDAAVIRDWARQLDDWLVEFSRSSPVAVHAVSETAPSSAEQQQQQQQRVVFRQYVLHRLVVLSIYHPARGCNLWSHSITPQEQHELLLSARATLKLHLHDDSIWANWDLVMITWAALIVIQGVEGGVGEADDLQNIQVHLAMLQGMQQPAASLCGRLIARLEASLQGVHTPSVVLGDEQQGAAFGQRTPGLDYQSWHIFDQASLEQIGYVQWPLQG